METVFMVFLAAATIAVLAVLAAAFFCGCKAASGAVAEGCSETKKELVMANNANDLYLDAADTVAKMARILAVVPDDGGQMRDSVDAATQLYIALRKDLLRREDRAWATQQARSSQPWQG